MFSKPNSNSSQIPPKGTKFKKSLPQINSYTNEIDVYDEGEFEMMSSRDYIIQENRAGLSHIGRRQNNHFEKLRRQQKSNTNVALSQLFDVKSMGEMAIFRNLFEIVQSWEILTFLGEYHVFLQVLKLQMEERSLNFDIDSFIKHDFKKDFLYETVPRTFICGLMRFKELREFKSGHNPFQVTEHEIKTLYMTSLLLINVGLIPKKQKTQKADQPSEIYFHRIVSYLLDQSGFLTPKLFNYISLNWGKIIEMILNQFEVDRNNSNSSKNTHKRQQNLNQDFSRFNIDEKKKKSLNSQKVINKIQQDEDFENEEHIYNQESIETLKSKRNRGYDMELRFLSESKPNENIQICQKTTENCKYGNNNFKRECSTVKYGNNNFKRECPTVKEEGKIESEKKIKLNSQNPVIKKAQILYNFGKVNTRDRTRRQKKRTRKITKNKNQKKQNQQPMKGNKIMEQKEEKVDHVDSQQFLCLDSEFENIYDDCEKRYSLRRQDSICSIDHFFSDSLRSSSNEEDHKMSNKEEFPDNQQYQTQQESRMEVEQPVENTANLNRRVRHEKREIDYMIKALIQDRFVMIQSIACQIYHSLKAVNAQVIQENIIHYRSNLAQLFESATTYNQ